MRANSDDMLWNKICHRINKSGQTTYMIGASSKMICQLSLIYLLAISCTHLEERPVNLTLDANSSGWYLIRLKVDRANGENGAINLKMNDNNRFQKVFVQSAKNVSFHVYDHSGEDISKQLEHVGLGATDTPHYYFLFYLPKPNEEQSELFYPDSSNQHYYDVTKAGNRLKDSLKETTFW